MHFTRKHLLLVCRPERCWSSLRSFSQESLARQERPCSVYLLREPLCSCHNPHDFSSPPTESFTSTSFSWVCFNRRKLVNKEARAQLMGTGNELKFKVCYDIQGPLLGALQTMSAPDLLCHKGQCRDNTKLDY